MRDTSVWKIGKLYYIWLTDSKRYFKFCYKYKSGAIACSYNLLHGFPVDESQSYANYKDCIETDYKSGN